MPVIRRQRGLTARWLGLTLRVSGAVPVDSGRRRRVAGYHLLSGRSACQNLAGRHGRCLLVGDCYHFTLIQCR
jgi:hypothetical protein